VIEDRSELNLLRRAIADLPEHRRQVLLLSRVDGMPHRDIADLLGVTIRTIETDLKQAVEHCADRMNRHVPAKFVVRRVDSSPDQMRARRGNPPANSVRRRALARGETNRPCQSFGFADPGCAGLDRVSEIR
jgi:RNA polymerase sigma-70 factor (ECF subfamily)